MSRPLKLWRKATALLASVAFLLAPFARAERVSLANAEFHIAQPPPLALQDVIGPDARPTALNFAVTGGVGLVQVGRGRDGWDVVAMRYAAANDDGHRWLVSLARGREAPAEVRVGAYDWELAPLARFAASRYDAAFTYFAHTSDGAQTDPQGRKYISYHPALANTLIGLRMMQLDLVLFRQGFHGYIRGAESRRVLFGRGESAAFGSGVDVSDAAIIRESERRNLVRLSGAIELYQAECAARPSPTCAESGQPFDTYIVGDLLSPVTFGLTDGRMNFEGGRVCWLFARRAAPGERNVLRGDPARGVPDYVRLGAFSQRFCNVVHEELNGLHPIVTRSGRRASWFVALMRRFKATHPAAFEAFVASLQRVRPAPAVETPTALR